MDIAYIKKIGFYLLLALLALALIVTLLYHAFDALSDDLELMFVSRTDHTETVEMPAFLSLEEYAIDDSRYVENQVVEYVSGKTSRVSSGDTVVRLYPEQSDRTLVLRVAELNEKIAFCKKANEYSTRQSVESLKSKIAKCEKEIASTDDLAKKNELSDELRVLLAAHAAKMDPAISYSKMIKSYEDEITEVYKTLGKASYQYKSDINGAYFSQCDGYEGMINEELRTTGSLDELCALLVKSGESGDHGSPDEAKKVGRLGKLVNMNSWYLVCVTDKDTSLRMNEGASFNVTLGKSEKTYRLTVERVVSERDDDRAVIIFSSSIMLECEDYSHFQTVKVSLKTTEGFKIPITAVRYENGVSGVYVLRGSVVHFRQIDIIGGGDGYVVAATKVSETIEGISVLNRYDRIIVRGQNLYDKKVII